MRFEHKFLFLVSVYFCNSLVTICLSLIRYLYLSKCQSYKVTKRAMSNVVRYSEYIKQWFLKQNVNILKQNLVAIVIINFSSKIIKARIYHREIFIFISRLEEI
jgi:hypothetical protein